MSKNNQQQQQLVKCKNCTSNSRYGSLNNNPSNANPSNNSLDNNLNDDAINQNATNSLDTTSINNSSLQQNNVNRNNALDYTVVVAAAAAVADASSPNQSQNASEKNDDSTLNRILSNRNSCIIDRLSYLCLNETLADVYFLVGGSDMNTAAAAAATVDNSDCSSQCNEETSEGLANEPAKNFNISTCQSERIPAHKLILSIGSQVFMAMFYGSGSQMMQPSDNLIQLPDVEPEPFKHMLRYLYTDELYVEPDSVMSTLYVAKKYAVNALEKECVDFLKVNLKPDNAFMLLQQALLFDENQLAELCLEVIDKHSIEAFQSECFLDIDLDTLILILKRDTLGIREVKLYYFVLKWAQNQCNKHNYLPINRENQQHVLGDAIKYIRFPLMSKEEFALAMNENESRVIDNDTIIDLFINLTLMNSNYNNNNNGGGSLTGQFQMKKLNYNDTPRCCLGGKEQVINRFCQVESRWGYSGTSDRVRFSVNRRIFVVGFGLYGSIYGKCEYQVIIQLIHYDSCTTCAQNTTTFTCDGTNTTFRVLFKEPIEISPDVDYIAAATLKGPDSFYGTKGLRKVAHDSGGKVTFQFQYASGNNNGTSVEDGQIPEIIFLYSC